MDKKITLVASKICPFTHRAWIALLQKNVDFDFHEPFLTETYLKAFAHDPNASGKVPIIIHGEHILTESDLVSWYVAQTFDSGNQLIPKDTFERAKMRYFIGEVPGKVVGAYYGMAGYLNKTPEEKAACVERIHSALELFQKSIKGPYIMGQQFTLADVFVFPWFERWCVFKHYFDLPVDKRYIKILKWFHAVRDRDSVKKTIQPKELFIEAFKSRFGS